MPVPWWMLLAVVQDAPVEAARSSERPVARVQRTERAPHIDGVLEPEVWGDVPTIGPLTQVLPVTGAPPTEATDVRVLYDSHQIYLGIRCHDREPSKIVATQASRDAELSPDDRLEIVIDTFLDRRSAFYFQMSPAGSKGDALISGDGQDFNKPWDGIWEGKTRIDEHGWVCEIAIPFKTLSFAKDGTTWGFNLNRYVKRRNEVSRWASPTNDGDIFQISRSGDLIGFEGLEQGIGLDVVPFGVATWSKERVGANHDEDLLGHAGVDLFYKLSTNMTMALTVNTDFAETEVDQRQVNLTRFPLFFPEKRDFFLQDSGIFNFADLGNDLIPFFSRRIGRAPTGEEVPILFGAKLTGRQDDWNVGVLDVQTEDTRGIDGENLFVARVSRNVGAQSSIGGIVTRGDPASGLENVVYGLDGNWSTNDGIAGKRTAGSLWFLESATEDAAGDDRSFGASLSYPNDLWSWGVAAKQIDENFNPALGFVPRAGVRRYDGELFFRPRLGGSVRQWSFGIQDSLVTDLDDHVETHATTLEVIGFELESGDELSLEVDQTREVLDQPFAITPSVTIAPGTYDDTGVRFEVDTASKRPLSFNASVTAGEFLGGDSVRWFAGLDWRHSALWNSGIEWEQSDIRFDQGDVETKIARLRCNFSFTPDLSWNNFLQWDSESDEYGIHSRWRWIPKPGQEFFLVFNQTLEDTTSVHPLFQQVAFKASYTFRF